ncbi:MAG: fumarate reductase/succinate dehydrogenase flavoprotein subunit [Bacteroides sp.]|nr:MAG: fumarate reductase/succinate dehydrogenase flavoprotein subunit [Bacteroides sp.]
MILNSKIPDGPIIHKWEQYKSKVRLVSPNNKKKFEIIIIGSGLAGSSAAATLAELGYNVKIFYYQDSPRRAHSIAAQGGINAAKNYQNDGDSIYRLFYDTIKGGDYRSREANVYRLAEISSNIIDQCVAQGIPFAREYNGLLNNRSFGGVQVSRTFYAAGQTGQQLLLGAYGSLMRQVSKGKIQLYSRHEMMDIVIKNGKSVGIISRNLINGKLERHFGHAVILATGGYSNVFYLSTNAMNSNVTAIWQAYKRGALFANPCFVQIHPTCIPISGNYQSKLTLMSESLRNDGRIWVPKKYNDNRDPNLISEDERDYYLERRYPAFGNLVPRDVAARAAKERCDAGFGVGSSKMAVYLDFRDAIIKYGKIECKINKLKNCDHNLYYKLGKKVIKNKYGNLFSMYKQITGVDPYNNPMMIYPAVHYTMGGLWIDYELMTNIKGLYSIGECNFSDHGANRLGASALMQGLADGYFILPYTIGSYLSEHLNLEHVDINDDVFKETELDVINTINSIINIQGSKSVNYFHKKLGQIMWNKCSISRSKEGLEEAIKEIKILKEDFNKNVFVNQNDKNLNIELEKAMRLLNFFDMSELMCKDALNRNESCGGHFRVEYQTKDNEPMRDDINFSHVSVWEYSKKYQSHILHKEKLSYNDVNISQRSYK